MTTMKIAVNNELDVISARMQARQMAKRLGFGTTDQARISLATSELARLICAGAQLPGEIVMDSMTQEAQGGIRVICYVAPSDPHSQQSLMSASRLVDESSVESEDSGQTRVTLIKWSH